METSKQTKKKDERREIKTKSLSVFRQDRMTAEKVLPSKSIASVPTWNIIVLLETQME